MDSFDLVIRGGTVVTSSETSRCDIGIRDGRIAAIHWVINPDKLTWIDAP